MLILFGSFNADVNAAMKSWLFCKSEATLLQLVAQAGILKAVPVRVLEGGSVGALLGVAVGGAIGDLVGKSVGSSVGDTVGDTVGDLVGVGDIVGGAIGVTVGDTVGGTVGDIVFGKTGAFVGW